MQCNEDCKELAKLHGITFSYFCNNDNNTFIIRILNAMKRNAMQGEESRQLSPIYLCRCRCLSVVVALYIFQHIIIAIASSFACLHESSCLFTWLGLAWREMAGRNWKCNVHLNTYTKPKPTTAMAMTETRRLFCCVVLLCCVEEFSAAARSKTRLNLGAGQENTTRRRQKRSIHVQVLSRGSVTKKEIEMFKMKILFFICESGSVKARIFCVPLLCVKYSFTLRSRSSSHWMYECECKCQMLNAFRI